jgi:hypothetical protein
MRKMNDAMARHSAGSSPRAEGWVGRLPRARAGDILAASVALAALSLTATFSPSGDIWAWLVWGYEVGHLSLDTTAGPSWKPLPVLVTTVLAPAGDAAAPLWTIVTRTAWLLGLVGAYRLASRLGGPLAGAIAVLGTLSIVIAGVSWLGYFVHGRTEMLSSAAILWAINRHLDGHPSQAFALGLVPALDRPVAWPLVALYGVYVWRRRAVRPAVLVAALASIPVLWLGPDLLGSGDPLTGARRAQNVFGSLTGLTRTRVLLPRVVELVPLPVWLGAAAVAVPFLPRGVNSAERKARRRVVLVLGGGVLAWVMGVLGMAFLGFFAVPRFFFPVAPIVAVLVGTGAAWLVGALPWSGARVLAGIAAIAATTVFVLAPLRALGARIAQGDDPAENYLAQALEAAATRDRMSRCRGQVALAGAGLGKARRVAWELRVPMHAVSVLKPAPARGVDESRLRGLVAARGGGRTNLDRAAERGEPVVRVGDLEQWSVYEVHCRPVRR